MPTLRVRPGRGGRLDSTLDRVGAGDTSVWSTTGLRARSGLGRAPRGGGWSHRRMSECGFLLRGYASVDGEIRVKTRCSERLLGAGAHFGKRSLTFLTYGASPRGSVQ